MIPEGEGRGLRFGPATFLDPDIVAIHVKHREEWENVGAYCDLLVAEGILRFWELGDPDLSSTIAVEDSTDVEPWTITHPQPDSSTGCTVLNRGGTE